MMRWTVLSSGAMYLRRIVSLSMPESARGLTKLGSRSLGRTKGYLLMLPRPMGFKRICQTKLGKNARHACSCCHPYNRAASNPLMKRSLVECIHPNRVRVVVVEKCSLEQVSAGGATEFVIYAATP